MSEGMSLEDMELVGQVSAEPRVPLDNLLSELRHKIRETTNIGTSPSGKYRVLEVDNFEEVDSVHGEFDTAAEALRIATEKTDERKRFASRSSVATIFYAYNPSGEYIGGNTWSDEE